MKRNPFPGTLLVVATLLLPACQNHYAINYRPAVAAYSARLTPPTPGEPQVISTTRLNDEMQTFQGSGYTVIGSSSFVTTDWKPEWARRAAAKEQGKAVGADVVLLTTESAGWRTIVGAAPNLSTDHAGPDVASQSAPALSSTAIYLRKTGTTP